MFVYSRHHNLKTGEGITLYSQICASSYPMGWFDRFSQLKSHRLD